MICMSVTVAYGNPDIEEGFVAFATANYFPCLKVLLDSVNAFSTRPIVAFGVNADIPFSTDEYPCLIKKRIDVDLTKVSAYHWKPLVLLKSGVRYGIYIDTDLILNAGVDDLFELCREAQQYPICPIHPGQPDDQADLMQALGVEKKSMPYVHNDQILFSESCRPFIEEWLMTGIKYQHLAIRHDEKVLNVLLWKHGATRYTELSDPFYGYVPAYIAGITPEEYRGMAPIKYHMFHGCKDPATASKILTMLVKHQQQHSH